MATATLLGRGRCPLCGNSRARVSVSRAGLACLTCNACNAQVFGRSENSDERLRALIVPEAPEPAPTPAAPSPAPVQPAPAAAPKAAPAPKPWGFF